MLVHSDGSGPVETKKSFCRFCHAFCGVEVDVRDGRVVAVRGDPDNAVSRGYTCVKGRAEIERIYHPDRLVSSKKRVGGVMVDIAAEPALDEIAREIAAIVDEHGPDAVAVYVGDGGHRTAAGGPPFVSKWLDALGSRRMYTSFTIDSPSMIVAASRMFGSPLPLQLLDIDHADVAMFVGTNPLTSHFMSMPQSDPRRRVQEARKRGMRLIVVDPRRSEIARLADFHLQVKPGEDATLLAGMVKVVIDGDLYDHEYVANHASGFGLLSEAVSGFDLDYVAERSQVPADLVRDAATAFATASSGGAQSGTGLHMARHQNLATQLVMTLNVLCGRYDRRGGLTRHAGAVNFELPDFDGPVKIPEYTGPKSRIRGIEGSFNYLGFFEEMPTNTLTDEILTPGAGQIKALIVHGGNPALAFADAESTALALSELRLLVVNDLFMTATAQHADYVLAVKHPFERADVPKLMDSSYPFPFSQYTPPLVDAPEGVLEDWEVFWGLAERLSLSLDLPGLEPGRKPTADEMIDALNSTSRIPMSEIRRYPDGHVWGDRTPLVGGVVPQMAGHADRPMAVGHPDVIAELAEVLAEPVVAGGGYGGTAEFGFRLITYRVKEVYCTQGQNLPSLAARRPFNPALINPAAMESLGVGAGDPVVVESGFGRVVAKVEPSDDLPPGVVALAFGWGGPDDRGVNVQYLIPDDELFDSVSGLALQSAIPVNVYRATDEAVSGRGVLSGATRQWTDDALGRES